MRRSRRKARYRAHSFKPISRDAAHAAGWRPRPKKERRIPPQELNRIVSCPICGHRMARRRLNAHKIKRHPGSTLPRRMQDFLREQAETVRRILNRKRTRHK